jgi:hypothetical protein
VAAAPEFNGLTRTDGGLASVQQEAAMDSPNVGPRRFSVVPRASSRASCFRVSQSRSRPQPAARLRGWMGRLPSIAAS